MKWRSGRPNVAFALHSVSDSEDGGLVFPGNPSWSMAEATAQTAEHKLGENRSSKRLANATALSERSLSDETGPVASTAYLATSVKSEMIEQGE